MRCISALLTVIVVAALACAQDARAQPSADPPPPAPSAEPFIYSIPTVTLESAGDAPRSLRRYAPVPGQAQEVTYTMETSQERPGDEKSIDPAFEMSVRAACTGRTASGDYTCTLELLDCRLTAPEPTPEELEVLKHYRRLVGFREELIVSDRGILLSAALRFPPGTPDDVRKVWRLHEPSRLPWIPMPAEEIGRGAKWSATYTFTIGGLERRVTATYTHWGDDEEALRIRMRVVHEIAGQPMLPSPDPAMQIKLQKSRIIGHGLAVLRPGWIVPSRADPSLSTRFDMIAATADQQSEVTIINEEKHTIRSSPPADAPVPAGRPAP